MSEPDGLYLLMGVNGVGKSTLAEELAATCEGARVIHASQELRRMMERLDNQLAEQLTNEEKLSMRVAHLVDLFRTAREVRGIVFVDTHLLLPTREGESVTYTNFWSDGYIPYVTKAYMLTAHPADIEARRRADQIATGRVRDLSEDNIRLDQEANVNAFMQLVYRGAVPPGSSTLKNATGLMRLASAVVMGTILSPGFDVD